MQRYRLTDLEGEFLKWVDDTHFWRVDSIAEADGVIFVCPLCYENNGCKRPGVHSVICWEPNVPQTTSPKPGRWNMLGTGLDDLTLQAGSSSIQITEGCKAHFFINGGWVHP